MIAIWQKNESGIFFILGSKNYLSDFFFITDTAQFWAQFSTKSNAPVFAFLQALWTWLIARRSITQHSAWLSAGKMRAGPVTRLHAGSTWFKAHFGAMAVGAKVGTWLGAWRAAWCARKVTEVTTCQGTIAFGLTANVKTSHFARVAGSSTWMFTI